MNTSDGYCIGKTNKLTNNTNSILIIKTNNKKYKKLKKIRINKKKNEEFNMHDHYKVKNLCAFMIQLALNSAVFS